MLHNIRWLSLREQSEPGNNINSGPPLRRIGVSLKIFPEKDRGYSCLHREAKYLQTQRLGGGGLFFVFLNQTQLLADFDLHIAGKFPE